jgi:2-methylcitrate dehydratase PrpD
MKAIDEIAQFIYNTNFQDIPLEVVEKARVPFLDTIGVALLGSTYPCGRIAIDFVRERGGAHEATVIGSGFKSSITDAAFANGVSAFSPDFDDFNEEIFLHPSAGLIPAILAVGEATRASGSRILAAYIIGWEVLDTIGRAAEAGRFAHRTRGWHPTCSIGTLGATAVAAKILNLDAEHIKIALGIAGSMASGTVQQYGTMAFYFHAGFAAKNGVTAAMLAQKGVTAELDILESQYGFLNLFNGEDNHDPIKPEKLGNPYVLVSPGFGLKKYACCSLVQCPIEGMQELVKREHFVPDDVELIEIGIHPKLKTQIARYDNPANSAEAQFSEQFHAAVGTVYPDIVGFAPYKEEILSDSRVQKLMRRVKVYVHPDLTTEKPDAVYTHYIKVKLKNGREFAFTKAIVGGDVKKPLTQEEVERKYKDCAGSVLPPSEIEHSVELINTLEKLEDIGILIKVLGAEARS